MKHEKYEINGFVRDSFDAYKYPYNKIDTKFR